MAWRVWEASTINARKSLDKGDLSIRIMGIIEFLQSILAYFFVVRDSIRFAKAPGQVFPKIAVITVHFVVEAAGLCNYSTAGVSSNEPSTEVLLSLSVGCSKLQVGLCSIDVLSSRYIQVWSTAVDMIADI